MLSCCFRFPIPLSRLLLLLLLLFRPSFDDDGDCRILSRMNYKCRENPSPHHGNKRQKGKMDSQMSKREKESTKKEEEEAEFLPETPGVPGSVDISGSIPVRVRRLQGFDPSPTPTNPNHGLWDEKENPHQSNRK